MKTVGLIAGIIIFVTIGALAVAMPERFRDVAIRASENSRSFVRPLYFPAYVKSRYYLYAVRALGILSILIGIVVAIVSLIDVMR